MGQSVLLSGDEARHMLMVLRMGKGDRLILINGMGTELTAEIASTDKDEVTLEIVDEMPCAAEPERKVTLFQCLPKAGKLETIIQKCVELGVYAVCPVFSKRCVVKPDRNESKLVRYNRVSHEAAKQSGRGMAPEVLPIRNLNDCNFSEFDLVLAAYEDEEDVTLKSILCANREAKNIAIVVGPEGGFERDEVEKILRSNENAHSVSLGKRILRTETAGMAMLAMLMYELEG